MIIPPVDAPSPPPSTLQLMVELVKAVAWPIISAVVMCVFYKPIRGIVESVRQRINTGASIKFYQVEVGGAPTGLPVPASGEIVTSDHMALINSSRRFPEKDKQYNKPVWAFYVVIQAREEVLNRIESAKYILGPDWPNSEYVTTERLSRFKLKELTWGEPTIRCEVKIKGQTEIVYLQRYINLTGKGPRI